MGQLMCACGRDAFREKGLLAPKQAGWANAAAKLAKPAGGLKVAPNIAIFRMALKICKCSFVLSCVVDLLNTHAKRVIVHTVAHINTVHA